MIEKRIGSCAQNYAILCAYAGQPTRAHILQHSSQMFWCAFLQQWLQLFTSRTSWGGNDLSAGGLVLGSTPPWQIRERSCQKKKCCEVTSSKNVNQMKLCLFIFKSIQWINDKVTAETRVPLKIYRIFQRFIQIYLIV